MLKMKSGFENFSMMYYLIQYCGTACLNHRLELAVGNALNATSGTDDLQSFLESLYSLYSQSPKNMRELSDCAHGSHVSLKKNRKGVYYSLGRFIFQRDISSKAFFSGLSPAFSKRFKKLRQTKCRKSQISRITFHISTNGGRLQRSKTCQKHYKTEITQCQKPKTYSSYNNYGKPYCFSGRKLYFGSTCRRSNVVSGCTIARRQRPNHLPGSVHLSCS